MAEEHIIIHLVHGTWPEGLWQAIKDAARRFFGRKRRDWPASGNKYWFQTEHPFHTQLQDLLIARGFLPTILELRWSGANSFSHRKSAAGVLAALIDQLSQTGSRQIVIGHSHGGSIGLEAVNMLEKTQVDLITMATPFLRVARFASNNSLWAIITPWWLASVAVFYVLAESRYGQETGSLMAFGMFLAVGLVVRFLQYKADWIDRNVVQYTDGKYKGPRVQCIRGIADEAGLSVNAGILGAWLSRTLLTGLGTIAGKAPDSLKLLAYAGLLAFMTVAVVTHRLHSATLWCGLALVLMPLCAVCASFGQGLLGGELAFAGLQFITAVESTPDADRDCLEVITLPTTQDTTDGLRHGVYNHPACLPAIVEGIAAPTRVL